ncbi:hypothetical protein [Kitasatospora aureofaciens]|uniref:hypothetical protein n=1 Tax=Kitasatospora aureofaciens TaxID=1894 RepID=UPI0004BECD07
MVEGEPGEGLETGVDGVVRVCSATATFCFTAAKLSGVTGIESISGLDRKAGEVRIIARALTAQPDRDTGGMGGRDL